MDIPHASRRTPDLRLPAAPPTVSSCWAHSRRPLSRPVLHAPSEQPRALPSRELSHPSGIGAGGGEGRVDGGLYEIPSPDLVGGPSQVEGGWSPSPTPTLGRPGEAPGSENRAGGTKGASGPETMLRSPAPHPADSRALPPAQVPRPAARREGVFKRGTQRLTSAGPVAQTPQPATHSLFTFLHPCRPRDLPALRLPAQGRCR